MKLLLSLVSASPVVLLKDGPLNTIKLIELMIENPISQISLVHVHCRKKASDHYLFSIYAKTTYIILPFLPFWHQNTSPWRSQNAKHLMKESILNQRVSRERRFSQCSKIVLINVFHEIQPRKTSSECMSTYWMNFLNINRCQRQSKTRTYYISASIQLWIIKACFIGDNLVNIAFSMIMHMRDSLWHPYLPAVALI